MLGGERISGHRPGDGETVDCKGIISQSASILETFADLEHPSYLCEGESHGSDRTPQDYFPSCSVGSSLQTRNSGKPLPGEELKCSLFKFRVEVQVGNQSFWVGYCTVGSNKLFAAFAPDEMSFELLCNSWIEVLFEIVVGKLLDFAAGHFWVAFQWPEPDEFNHILPLLLPLWARPVNAFHRSWMHKGMRCPGIIFCLCRQLRNKCLRWAGSQEKQRNLGPYWKFTRQSEPSDLRKLYGIRYCCELQPGFVYVPRGLVG